MDPIFIGVVVAGVVAHFSQNKRKSRTRGRSVSHGSRRPSPPRPSAPSHTSDSSPSSDPWSTPHACGCPEPEVDIRGDDSRSFEPERASSDTGDSGDCGDSGGGD